MTFTNSYTAKDTSVAPEGTKVLTGRELADNEFSFIVTDKDGNVVSTGLSKADGTIAFTPIGFTKVGTYKYTISEVKGNLGGVTYDETTYTMTVTVTDDGHGRLVTAVTYSAPVAFENTYAAAPTSVDMEATKSLSGRELNEGEFEFVLTDAQGNEVKANNNADGSISFETIHYTEPGTYTYTLTETNNGVGGVTYDETTYTVTVKVVDNGKGSLDAIVYVNNTEILAGEDGVHDLATFYNSYAPAAVPANLTIVKVLTGRELQEGEFQFVLTDDQGNVITTNNTAGGVATFDGLSFTEAGTYTYTLTETKGELGGITYDETAYAVVVTVKDDLKGSLYIESVTVDGLEVEAGADGSYMLATFRNTYAPTDLEVLLVADKTLKGRDLKSGEFVFSLTDAEGNVTKAVNDADGTVTFKLNFQKAGTYTYTMREVRGGDNEITYDNTKHEVVITITDDGKGELHVVSVTVDGKLVQVRSIVIESGVTFVNEYEEPKTPDTGDEMPLMLMVSLMFGSAAALAVLLMKKRRA